MSVHRRGKGWRVRWRDGDRNRSREFALRADAERFDLEMRRLQQLGAFAMAEPSSRTLDSWLAEWWDLHAVEWSENTRRVRRLLVETWVVPYLGSVRLRDLGTARIKTWRAEIAAAGAPPTQTNNALGTLSAVLGRAVESGLIPTNPCAPVRKVGRPTPTRPRALSPREIEAIRAELPRQQDRAAWGLMAYAGLRPAEALAVRWGDFTGPVLVVDAMKTLRRRAVDVIEPLADDLAELRSAEVGFDDLIVTAPEGGPVNLNNWRSRVFGPACARAGVRATPYNGRTSYCSLLVHEGRSLAYVAASMGNSARIISDHYLHVLRAAELGVRVTMSEAIRIARVAIAQSHAIPAEVSDDLL